jgi:hypothetical protein
MAQKTAMHQMLDELMAHEYTIPLELIVKCKELLEVEKEQIEKAFYDGQFYSVDYFIPDSAIEESEQYYNETYTNGL